MGAWEVKSTNKNGSGTAREEEASEGKARLAQRSTMIAFPTARNVQVSLLGRRKKRKAEERKSKMAKEKRESGEFSSLYESPVLFSLSPLFS